ncbi:MAG TPA: hypothetical protein ENG93_02515 [Nitrospirae bacterium]|nr:hypothetical protein [Nitrospirota bacterium]
MNLLQRVNPREKKFLLIGFIIVVLIIVYRLTAWYGDTMSATREYAEARQMTLQKQLKKISGKESMRQRSMARAAELAELESGLLTDRKPPVAAASIQRSLKQMAVALNIDIKVEKTLSPVETGSYPGIPVEIGFTATTENLKNFLYRIKTFRQLLTVQEMKTRVTNLNNPRNAYTTLVVTGFIKKEQSEEPDAP